MKLSNIEFKTSVTEGGRMKETRLAWQPDGDGPELRNQT